MPSGAEILRIGADSHGNSCPEILMSVRIDNYRHIALARCDAAAEAAGEHVQALLRRLFNCRIVAPNGKSGFDAFVGGELIFGDAAGTLAGFGTRITATQVTGNTATSASDRVSRTLYDGDGRVVYGVDAEGYVTKNAYDGANNIIKAWRYAAAVSVDNTATNMAMTGMATASASGRMAHSIISTGMAATAPNRSPIRI